MVKNFFITLLLLFTLSNCGKKGCPPGFFGEECDVLIIEEFKGEYCGTLTEEGDTSQTCFEVQETPEPSIFVIDVNIKGKFTGEGTDFVIYEKDIYPAKITGGSGNFNDNKLFFKVNYEVFGIKTSSTFIGVR
jgi:hypothetical protein